MRIRVRTHWLRESQHCFRQTQKPCEGEIKVNPKSDKSDQESTVTLILGRSHFPCRVLYILNTSNAQMTL